MSLLISAELKSSPRLFPLMIIVFLLIIINEDGRCCSRSQSSLSLQWNAQKLFSYSYCPTRDKPCTADPLSCVSLATEMVVLSGCLLDLVDNNYYRQWPGIRELCSQRENNLAMSLPVLLKRNGQRRRTEKGHRHEQGNMVQQAALIMITQILCYSGCRLSGV